LSYCFSILSKTIIEQAVNAELQLLDEISLDVVVSSKDSHNTVIRDHVESMICSSNFMEVLSIFILIYRRGILHLYYKYAHVYFREERLKLKEQ